MSEKVAIEEGQGEWRTGNIAWQARALLACFKAESEKGELSLEQGI